jgi:hypothetical protein
MNDKIVFCPDLSTVVGLQITVEKEGHKIEYERTRTGKYKVTLKENNMFTVLKNYLKEKRYYNVGHSCQGR